MNGAKVRFETGIELVLSREKITGRAPKYDWRPILRKYDDIESRYDGTYLRHPFVLILERSVSVCYGTQDRHKFARHL